MRSNPLISVLISVYNGQDYLRETIDSIQKSTFKNFEIILIDDGSTDGSKMLCEQLALKHKNIRFYASLKNKGLSNQLNFGLKKAKGQYICRINQDDVMLPNRLRLQAEFLHKQADVVAVGSYLKLFTNEGKEEVMEYQRTDEMIKKTWLLVSPFADPAVMYRKEVAIKAGKYNQKFWPADDLHLWYRMGKMGKLANIPLSLTAMRWHKKAASQAFFRRQILNTFAVHTWAHRNVVKASLSIQIYWIIQLLAGLVLGPRVVWFVYKKLKHVLHYAAFLLRKSNIPRLVAKVSTIPSKLSISGLYSK